MPERYKRGINWVLAFTVATAVVKCAWTVSTMASDVAGVRSELQGIRLDFKLIQTKVQDLDVRTTRLEERQHISTEWKNNERGPNQ